ncbi:myeloid leukemia factor 1 isoform X1 [Ambystoma mexicanum]|uniref:myeloid leukemia factor 1 isoform X1 n=1 Tax=Ambystoma mexicanum TaxID=8296 RepID=UPI0037E88C27
MFGRLLREFEEDPFFSEPLSTHQEHMRHMMRSFSEPFGQDPFHRITDRGEVGRRGGQRDIDVLDPFQSMDSAMANMRKQMFDMKRNFDCLPTGPDAHSFSSSKVMTFSKVGNEPPKIFEASSQVRQAPGGIKETRKGVKDSESGIEAMAIGHHIQDRAHVIEKSRNSKTGKEEVKQDFLNLDEGEALTFDEEWQRKTRTYKLGGQSLPVHDSKQRHAHSPAIKNA